MSFSFFRASRPKSGSELVRSTKDSFLALDAKTAAELRALEKALEEVEKNLLGMRQMLLGDGEVEPSPDQISQLTLEICKEDVLDLFVHKLPLLNWEARKDLVLCWGMLLRQVVDSKHCCATYLDTHPQILDFLVVCYDNKDIALNCGSMLRECIKYPSLVKYILESASFQLFFKYIELPNFDIASDALCTFKDLLTKHENVVANYLSAHYEQFFELYRTLLTSANYVTRRQSLKLLLEFLLEPPNAQTMVRYITEVQNLKITMKLLKDSSKNIQMSAFHIFKVFVANPNKPEDIIALLVKNHESLIKLLQNLPFSTDDEQFEEEKDILMKEIHRLTGLVGVL